MKMTVRERMTNETKKESRKDCPAMSIGYDHLSPISFTFL